MVEQVVNNKKIASGEHSACAYFGSPPLKGIIPKMIKLLLMSSIISFPVWGGVPSELLNKPRIQIILSINVHIVGESTHCQSSAPSM